MVRGDGRYDLIDASGVVFHTVPADPGLPALKFVATNDPSDRMPQIQTGFLRDAPFYVTDANRNFVVVGSAPTQEDGVRLMKKYKAELVSVNPPDFVVTVLDTIGKRRGFKV